MPPRAPSQRLAPLSSLGAVIDHGRIDALLAPWVPDARDRAFVVRCILDEGPAHHRGANYVLLALLGRLAEVVGQAAPAPEGPDSVPVRFKLPPHLLASNEDGQFPLKLPTRAIEILAPKGTPEHTTMVECLTDGPPQHSLANAAMMCLITALLEKVAP